MRIAYLITSLGIGGAERQVIGLARRMTQRGHIVKLFILLPPGEQDWSINSGPQPLEALHLNVRKQPLNVLQALARGATELRVFHPDLIHSHNFHGNLAARILRPFLPQTPVLSTIHNIYEGAWPRMLAYRLTDPLSSCTIAVSEAVRERYIQLRAVPAAKISVISNGIETSDFTPDTARRAQTRAALGLRDEFLWLATGRLAPAKDYPTLLCAFAQLLPAAPAAKLVIAGFGAPEYTTELRALANSLNLIQAIHWLGPRSDIPALLDAADAFVLSSAWEGMPLALGEAMSMAKPIVATDAGGVRELAGPGVKLIPPQKAEALAATMLDTMHLGAQARAESGQSARARILEHFNMDTQSKKWEEIYASMLY